MAFPRFLQKLLKYFNGAIISIFFVLWSSNWSLMCSLYLNEALLLLVAGKSIVTAALFKAYSSIWYCDQLPNAFE